MNEYVIDVNAGEDYEPKLEYWKDPTGRMREILPDQSAGAFYVGCKVAWRADPTRPLIAYSTGLDLTVTGFYRGSGKYDDEGHVYARLSNNGSVKLSSVVCVNT